MGNAILQANGVSGASRGAIAKADTTEATGIGATIKHSGSFTGRDAIVGGFFSGSLTVSVAMNKGNDISRCFYLDAQYLTQLLGGGFGTGDTEIGLGVIRVSGERIS